MSDVPDVPDAIIEKAELAITLAKRPEGTHPDDWPTCWDLASIALAAVWPDIAADRDRFAAEVEQPAERGRRWHRVRTFIERDGAVGDRRTPRRP